eukprot:963841-Alexandrium_andersonii.AAC.1
MPPAPQGQATQAAPAAPQMQEPEARNGDMKTLLDAVRQLADKALAKQEAGQEAGALGSSSSQGGARSTQQAVAP